MAEGTDSNSIRDEQHPVIGSVLHRNWQLQERLTIAEAELSDARQEIERLLAEKQEMAAALADLLVIADTLPGVFDVERILRARGLVEAK